MGNATHTPGPWEFLPSDHYGYAALWNPETREEILVTGGLNDGDEPITWMGEELSEANARLIAAAPETSTERDALLAVNAEMLEALRMADAAMNHMGDLLNANDISTPEGIALATLAFEAVEAVLTSAKGGT
ncbi:MAG: hypothetical protein JKY94_01070 [Rhodobacteraceae bacterium]|nr:hypothetical protein [Paracoccaceae bacterium]